MHRALAVRYGSDLGVASGSHLAWDLWSLGFPAQACPHSQAARTLAAEVAHPLSLAQALVFAAILHQWRREVLAAHAQAGAATTLATEQGLPYLGPGYRPARLGAGHAGPQRGRRGRDPSRARRLPGHGVHGAPGVSPGPCWRRRMGPAEISPAGLEVLAEALAVMDTTAARFYEPSCTGSRGPCCCGRLS